MSELLPKPCKICGEVFKPKSQYQMACSVACSEKNRAEARRRWHLAQNQVKHRSCKVCGVDFLPTYGPEKTCSKACSDENRRRGGGSEERAGEAQTRNSPNALHEIEGNSRREGED